MTRIVPVTLVRNPQPPDRPPSVNELRQRAADRFDAALDHIERPASEPGVRMRELEREVRDDVFALGGALLAPFLGLVEQRLLTEHAVRGRFEWFEPSYRKAPATPRNLSTLFGVLRYHRLYMREVAEGERHGFHPLDLELGLSADRFTWNTLMLSVHLATKLAFAEARSIMSDFLAQPRSTGNRSRVGKA